MTEPPREFGPLRTLTPHDLDGIMDIETASFPDAWSRESIGRHFASPGFVTRGFEIGGRLAGFFMASLDGERLHLLNIAVAPDRRRRGAGTHMLHDVDRLARQNAVDVIELEVRENNLAAQLLYRSAGYRATGIARRRYGPLDGYLMSRAVPVSG